jgi:hypothetical protein
MKKKLLKVIGVVLAIGCAPAGAVDPAGQPDANTPAVRQQTLVASAVGYVAQATSGGLAHAGSLQLPSGSTGSSSNDSRIALSMTPAPGSSSPRLSRTFDGQQGGGYLVSASAIPEPSGGAMLLCGLAVLAFIARRKTQAAVD